MCARFFLTLATQIQSVILGWQMYLLTKDPLYLGLIGLAEAVPALGLALHAGYFVDRKSPSRMYRLVLEVSLLSAILMLVSNLGWFQLEISWQITALFASSFLTGLSRAFSQPAIYVMVPRMVKREDLPRASAWMTTALQSARVSGPAVGGLLFGYLGIVGSSTIVCLLIFAAIVCCLAMSPWTHPPSVAQSRSPQSRKAELLLGAAFVLKHPILLPALSLDMISVLFGGVTALLPLYAAEVLSVGPQGLGALRAAPAIGALLTSFLFTRFDFRTRAGHWLFGAVTGFGVAILVFAISQNFWISLAALALSGAFDSVSMVIRTSAVQLSSPNSMRGRISAVNSIFIGSSNELGEFESGVLARFFGTVPAAVFGGIACLATVGCVAYLCPQLRRLNLHEILGEED